MIRPLVLWNVSPNSMINQLISMYISRFGARDMRNSFYCNINTTSQCFSITNTSITFSDIRSLPPYASRYIAVPKLYIQRYKKKTRFSLNNLVIVPTWSQCYTTITTHIHQQQQQHLHQEGSYYYYYRLLVQHLRAFTRLGPSSFRLI